MGGWALPLDKCDKAKTKNSKMFKFRLAGSNNFSKVIHLKSKTPLNNMPGGALSQPASVPDSYTRW